jgi:hypothetical protein
VLGAADDTVTVGLAETGAEVVALATAVLPEELHAVSTSATPANDAQAATRRAHDKSAFLMNSPTLRLSNSGSASHVVSKTYAAAQRFEKDYAAAEMALVRLRLLCGQPKHWPSPR